jgi:hypothetical protein
MADDFRLTAEHFNTAMAAAGIKGLSVSERGGVLHLDSGELDSRAVIDKLMNGLVLLHYAGPKSGP